MINMDKETVEELTEMVNFYYKQAVRNREVAHFETVMDKVFNGGILEFYLDQYSNNTDKLVEEVSQYMGNALNKNNIN